MHSSSKTIAILSALVMAAASVSWLPEAGAQSREGLDIQEARARLNSHRKAPTYDKRWNLDDLPPYAPRQNVSGVIRLAGSNFIADGSLGEYWEEGFRQFHPDARFEYKMTTALNAIPALCWAAADLAPCRHIMWREHVEFLRTFSYDPLEITMATGSFNQSGFNPAYAVIVNRENPISRLTLGQLDGIFGAERSGGYQGIVWHEDYARDSRENIRTWGQLGLTGEWADHPINVYGYDMESSRNLYFSNRVLKASMKWNEKLRMYQHYVVKGALYQAGRQLADDLEKDRYGIGWDEIQLAIPRTKTKALALAEKDGGAYVEMTLDNVRNRSYPLWDEVYIYANRKPGTPLDPKIREYLRYVLSREGQEQVQRDGKYLPLTRDVVMAQLMKLE